MRTNLFFEKVLDTLEPQQQSYLSEIVAHCDFCCTFNYILTASIGATLIFDAGGFRDRNFYFQPILFKHLFIYFLLDTTFKAYSIHIPDNLGLAALFILFGAENTYAYFTHSR